MGRKMKKQGQLLGKKETGRLSAREKLSIVAVEIIKGRRDIRYCVHRTTREANQHIRKEGLKKMARMYIHFAAAKQDLRPNSEVLPLKNIYSPE